MYQNLDSACRSHTCRQTDTIDITISANEGGKNVRFLNQYLSLSAACCWCMHSHPEISICDTDITSFASWDRYLLHWCSTGHYFIPILISPSVTLIFRVNSTLLHSHPESTSLTPMLSRTLLPSHPVYTIYDSDAQWDITSSPFWEHHLGHWRSYMYYYLWTDSDPDGKQIITSFPSITKLLLPCDLPLPLKILTQTQTINRSVLHSL